MYTTSTNNIPALKKGEKIKFDVKDQGAEKVFQSVWDAICLDRPDLFYVDTNKISFITETSKNLFGKVSYSYYMEPKNNGNYLISTWQSSEDVNSAIYSVENIARTVTFIPPAVEPADPPMHIMMRSKTWVIVGQRTKSAVP